MTPLRTFLIATLTVIMRPRLWATAFVMARRFAPDRWWATRPFLPLPDPALLRFRGITQYGDPSHAPDPYDIVVWLRWCKAENQRQR
jgi:hypothetical protein